MTEMKSVYSAVRTGSLNKAVCASSLKVKMLPINDTIILLNTNCTGQEEIPVHHAEAKPCDKQLYNYSSHFIS